VGEQRVVGLPAVGEFGADARADRFAGRVGVEQFGNTGPGYDDARVAVPGCQDAQSPGFQVECRRVVSPAQGVEDDGDLVLGTLEAVGGVDPDLRRDARGGPGQRLADLVRLVAVGDADRDVGRPDLLAAR
jgi:hypothetical protein